MKDCQTRRWLRALRFMTAQAILVAIAVLAMDWILVRWDLIRPPFKTGDAEVGFISGKLYRTSRTSAKALAENTHPCRAIVMVGDSHSALLFPELEASHEFIMEKALAKAKVPAVVISAGQGKYSPLQEYLLYETKLADTFNPQVVLVNFYSGNDFFDILRPDDRPHYIVDKENSIQIAPPMWLAYHDPDGGSWREESRLIWLADAFFDKVGFPKLSLRVRFLSETAESFNAGLTDIVSYIADVRKSREPRMSYDGAFAAQVLNQALFFEHFPQAQARSLRFLMEILQRASNDHPDVLFVLTVIPSPILAEAMPPSLKGLWGDVLGRVRLEESVVRRMERELVQQLVAEAESAGWLVVEVAGALKEKSRASVVFSEKDLHVNEIASQMIGEQQAIALLRHERFRGMDCRNN